jgi:hypothetical protein
MKRNTFLASLFGLTNLPFPKLYQDKAAAPPNTLGSDGVVYGQLCHGVHAYKSANLWVGFNYLNDDPPPDGIVALDVCIRCGVTRVPPSVLDNLTSKSFYMQEEKEQDKP